MGLALSRAPAAPGFRKGVWYDAQGCVDRSVYDDLREGAHPHRPLSRRVLLAEAPHPGFDGFWEDDLVMVFVPDKPCAAEHLLVVPKDTELRNVHALTPEHLALLAHMRAVAQRHLRDRARRGDSPASRDCRLELSYHVPPFNSIDHLHLHAFALPFDTIARRVKYLPHTPWCVTHDRLVAKLRAVEAAGRGARGKLR
ncbi:hypothetical protein T492DRAFT_1011199 [Pavlovales sp. CCMP2436]|nr:hypothetical protein T492DRAFT_1011199 [Pavlovales sp. CCMP2436]|mmetsp:Transcript_38523/g.95311  ORF Transcript_38523/g.95311 Transcript_38523/m.95311 type:complete len:198 (+) Transcript_38523:56-649(+)